MAKIGKMRTIAVGAEQAARTKETFALLVVAVLTEIVAVRIAAAVFLSVHSRKSVASVAAV